jgi:hypothetical protein
MGNPVIEDRLRAARPEAADVDEDAFDAELLAQIQRLPVQRRRRSTRRIAIPVVTAGVTLAAAAALMFAGGPGDIGGPPSAAAAIERAVRWLSPPAGTVLHVRSVETQGDRTTTRETWQSADDPASSRELMLDDKIRYETAGNSLYDPTTNTIYEAANGEKSDDNVDRIIGDPIVKKVRFGLQNQHLTVTGRVTHNGQDAWEISLNPDANRPAWTIWVSATDGKPLELRDPGRDANEQASTIRWETYEVLDDANAAQLATLQGAHPTANVIRDRARVDAALKRVFGDKRPRAKK